MLKKQSKRIEQHFEATRQRAVKQWPLLVWNAGELGNYCRLGWQAHFLKTSKDMGSMSHRARELTLFIRTLGISTPTHAMPGPFPGHLHDLERTKITVSWWLRKRFLFEPSFTSRQADLHSTSVKVWCHIPCKHHPDRARHRWWGTMLIVRPSQGVVHIQREIMK